MANLTCGSDVFIASSECSGHGTCSNGTCVCATGWSGASDWVSATGKDCHINETVVKVLWACNVTFYIGILIWSIPRVHEILLRIKNRKRMSVHHDAAAEAKDIAIQVSENKGYLGVLIFIVVMFPSNVSLGLLQIVQSSRVGVDVAATVCFMFARSGFYIAGHLFQPYLLDVVIGIRRNSELAAIMQHGKMNEVLLVMENLFGVSALVSAIFSRGYSEQTTKTVQVATFVVYNIGMAFCLAGLFLQAKFLRDQISKSLDQYSEGPRRNDKLTRLKKRLIRIQATLMRQTCIQGIVFALQGIIPPLWVYFSYILPITYLIPGITTINVIKALRGTAENPSSAWTRNPSFRKTSSTASDEQLPDSFTASSEDPPPGATQVGSFMSAEFLDLPHRGSVVDPSSLPDSMRTAQDFVDGPSLAKKKGFRQNRSGSLTGIPLLGSFRKDKRNKKTLNGEGLPTVAHPEKTRRKHKRAPSYSDVPFLSTNREAVELDKDDAAIVVNIES